MSGEELTSIEKNGSYWLSKSNTAYHIINPNATSLTIKKAMVIIASPRVATHYYVLDATGNSIRCIMTRVAPGCSAQTG